jgi:hypothetical protein
MRENHRCFFITLWQLKWPSALTTVFSLSSQEW